ncbi:choline transporter-like 1 [Eupeodes corollae]|uniref:choline transporter-like 1 n=1 Tax=Eupeodes corollae TaxID=290404 RepID=UPI0024906526|nr:choline transporter-like 1 [Eupeodes corollae]
MDINRNKNLKRCTDIVWLVLLLTFLALLILIAVISINNSGYNAIIKGHDSFGNICGSKDNVNYANFSQSGLDTTQLPYLYYMDIFNIPLVFKICLENCFIDTHYFHEVAIDFWREFENYRCDYQITGIKASDATIIRYCPNENVFNR